MHEATVDEDVVVFARGGVAVQRAAQDEQAAVRLEGEGLGVYLVAPRAAERAGDPEDLAGGDVYGSTHLAVGAAAPHGQGKPTGEVGRLLGGPAQAGTEHPVLLRADAGEVRLARVRLGRVVLELRQRGRRAFQILRVGRRR